MTDPSARRPDPSGNTVSKEVKGPVQPRMPHERDESADSQHSRPRPVIKQAYDDVQSGQEDTDLRGSRGRRQPSVPQGTGET